MTTIGFSTDTDVREDRRTVPTDDGDHERFSHYVEKFPVCPECKEVWESLREDAGDGAGSGSGGSGGGTSGFGGSGE